MKNITAVLSLILVLTLSFAILIPMPAEAANPVISDIATSAIGETSAVISWVTDIDATTNVGYDIADHISYDDYPGNSPAVPDATADNKNHAIILTGLTAGTTYHYMIASDDGSGDVSYSASHFATKFFTISGVAASSVTATSAIVTWNTSVNATSNVEYGTSVDYGSNAPATADTVADSTAHYVALDGLSPNTLYHYRANSRNGSGNQELSVDLTFTTLGTTAPVISGVGPTGTLSTASTASIVWATDQKATSQVEYGIASGSYGNMTSLISTKLKNHSMQLAGLTPDTTYYYRVISENVYNDKAVSGEFSFKTAADNSLPVISGLLYSNVTGTTAVISWDTDEPATRQVEYGETIAYGSATTLETALSTEHVVVLIGLTPGGAYNFRVKSADAFDNVAVSANYTFTTSSDTTAPLITGVNATNLTASSATIAWTTDEMSTSQVYYGLATPYTLATVLDTGLVYAHSVSITGLQSGTIYHYAVRSVDDFGNPSTSDDATFSTLDAVPPTKPQNLSVTTPTNDNTPTFTWDAATDAASGVASYEVRIDSGSFTNAGNVTTYTIADTAALSDGSHSFEVRAMDSAGNTGDAGSLAFNIDATKPTTPANIAKTTSDRDNTPAFTWDASTDAASGVDRYQVSLDGAEFTAIGTTTNFTVSDTNVLADGNHAFSVRAIDRAGNIGETGTLNFIIDATPPAAPENIAKTTPDSDSTPTFEWDAAVDATSGVESYQIRFDTGGFTDIGNVTAFTVADGDLLSSGSHVFEVRAVDEAGNAGSAATLTFIITSDASGSSTGPIIAGIAIGVVAVIGGLVYLMRRRRA